MIISHANKFIFFKPLKVGGSSVEVALIKSCGSSDIITGTDYLDEVNNDKYDYSSRNCSETVILKGESAKKFLIQQRQSGILTHPPITDEVIRNSNEIECHRSKFNSHISPMYLKVQYKNFLDIMDYHKFTIVRNPWDLMVSYFWWCFSPSELLSPISGDIVKDSISELKSKNWMSPQPEDSERVLATKFSAFIRQKAYPPHDLGNINEKVDVVTWLSQFNSHFYSAVDIDTVMRFESIQDDFDLICDKLNIKRSSLPRLKSSIRKSPAHYSRYYSDRTRDQVADAFFSVINKFGYSF